MKKIGLIIYMFLSVMILTGYGASKQKNDGFTQVRGYVVFDKYKPKGLILNKVIDGKGEEVATTKIGDDNSFGFALKVEQEGFYEISSGGNSSWIISIYLKPNDNINLEINTNKISYQLLGKKNSKENIALCKWDNYISDARLGSKYFWLSRSNYKTLFPKLDIIHKEYKNMIPSLKVKNNKFNKLMELKIHTDVEFTAIMLLFTPRTVHPKREDYIALYKDIKYSERFVNDDIFELPEGARMLTMYVNFKGLIENSIGKDNSTILSTDRQKGEYYLSSKGGRIKDYVAYEMFLEEYGKYMVTPNLKARLDEICTKVVDTKSGSTAPNFTYPDVNDKMVSLVDFKGKVVLIDVWATWCGPCLKQVPYLNKLEKEFHGNDNIVFLSVSTDVAKDKQKWLDMIKEKNMGGVQLFADGFSKITNDYKINGIPRFMIINKDGTIYTADAPRPSDPALKKILLKLL